MRKLIYGAATAVVAALALAVPAAAMAAASVTVNHSATTVLSARPDGGNHDNVVAGTNHTWANDNFTRNATLHLVGEVPLSHCGSATSTGHCYLFTGTVSDGGHFTVNPTAGSGAQTPGNGLGGAQDLYVGLTGNFTGYAQYTLFSSWKTADRLPPLTENDGGNLPTGRHTTTRWPLRFFRLTGPAFWDSAGNPASGGSFSPIHNWSWTYVAPAGSDSQCSGLATQWVDHESTGGAAPGDGNILAPDTAHC
jgi:hypothetical protein